MVEVVTPVPLTVGQQVSAYVRVTFTKPLFFFCFFLTAFSAFSVATSTPSPYVRVKDILEKFINDPTKDEPKFIKSLAKLLLRPLPAVIANERVVNILLGPLPTLVEYAQIQYFLSYISFIIFMLFSEHSIILIFFACQAYNMLIESNNTVFSFFIIILVVVFLVIGFEETLVLLSKP